MVRFKRVLLFGTRSADHIKASGQSGCIQRPDTWLHPNASLKRQIPLAPRAPSIHGPSRQFAAAQQFSRFRGEADVEPFSVCTEPAAFDPEQTSGGAACACDHCR